MAGGQAGPLKAMVEALQEIADAVNSTSDPQVSVNQVVRVCRLAAPFVFAFQMAFDFAALELQTKAENLDEASKKFSTIKALVQSDVAGGDVRRIANNSHSRNLVRVNRAADLVRVFFQQILTTEGTSLVPALTTAYDQVFAPYHGPAVRSAVSVAMEELLTKHQLFNSLKESEESGKKLMKNYIEASTPVIDYINKLFLSSATGTELLRMI